MPASPNFRASTRYAHRPPQQVALSSLLDDTDGDGPTLVKVTPHRAPLRVVPHSRFEDRTEIMQAPPSFDEPRPTLRSAPTPEGQPRRRESGIVPKMPQGVGQASSVRVSKASFTGVHTRLLTLSPAFHAALKQVAPKKRRLRAASVFGLAVAVFVAVLAADRTTRTFVLEEGERILLTR